MKKESVFKAIMIGAMAAGLVLSAVVLSYAARSESGPCLQPTIEADSAEVEVQANAVPAGEPPAAVHGILDLSNSNHRQAHVTLTVFNGGLDVVHHYTISRESAVGIAWQTTANQIFRVTIQSTQPLVCENSSYTVQ